LLKRFFAPVWVFNLGIVLSLFSLFRLIGGVNRSQAGPLLRVARETGTPLRS
jgi:hypothetical protein